MAYIQETEFNGKPVLSIGRDANDKFAFKIGAKKLRAILENLPECQEFVEKYTGALT